jgi:hypothetical protein
MYYGLERVLQFQISQTTIVQNFLKTDERGNTRFYGLVLYKVSVNSPYHVENTGQISSECGARDSPFSQVH